jgi:phage/plasmid-like protein (TIGR03299 family)
MTAVATPNTGTATAVSTEHMLVQQPQRGTFYGKSEAMPEGLDTDAVLELAGLNYDVELRPLYVAHPDGTHTLVEDHVTTVRTDTDTPLGIVSPRYQHLNNRDAFSVLDAGISEAGAEWVAAGQRNGGAQVWGLLKLRDEVVAAGESIDPYLLYINDHTGGGALRALNTPVRPRCTNAFPLAMRKASANISIRHTGDTAAKLDQARQVFAQTHEYLHTFAQTADQLALQKVSDRQLQTWVKALWPDPEGKGERAAKNAQEAREAVLTLTREAPNLEGHHGTAWAFVNGVGEYVDWFHSPGRTGSERMGRLVQGGDTILKNRALQLALSN